MDMSADYREFVATRESSIGGLNLVETKEKSQDPKYADLKKKALRIVNSFEYDSYKDTGIFLYYEENVKSFVIVKAEAGRKIDSRTNMRLCLRIPVGSKRDGFEECLAFFYEWQTGDTAMPEAFTVSGACRRYGISDLCLENLLRYWLKNVCASYAETMQIYSGSMQKPYDAEFVGTMAKLFYALLPTGRIKNYSFAWRVAPQKCRGFRILMTEQPQGGRCLDLAEEGGHPEKGPDGLMVKRIANAFLSGTQDGRRFMDAFDWYFMKAAGYDAMMWNFYYYLLDKEEAIPCNLESFLELETGLQRQMEKGVEKAKTLYAALFHSVLETSFSHTEGIRLLDIYLTFLFQSGAYQEGQLQDFWFLLEKCAGTDGEETYQTSILNYLRQIRKISGDLYLALMETGLERKHDFLAELFEFQKLRKRKDVEGWISDLNHKKFLSYPVIKAQLMERVRIFFRQDSSVDEIRKAAWLGVSIDEKMCISFMEDYLREGTKKYVSGKDTEGWAQYLLERKDFWKSARPLLIFLTDQYTELAEEAEMPLEKEAAEAMISVGTIMQEAGRKKAGQQISPGEQKYVPKTEHVQRILLRRHCEAYENGRKNERNTERYYPVISMLLKWDTGNLGMVPELQKAASLLAKMASLEAEEQMTEKGLDTILDYRIREEAPDKDRLYRYWLEQIGGRLRDPDEIWRILDILEERSQELLHSHVSEELKRLYLTLMKTAKEEQDVQLMECILKSAEGYQQLLELHILTDMFWKNISVESYAGIRKYEKKLWKKESVFQRFPSGSSEERLYRIYRTFWEQGSSESLLKEFYDIQGKIKRERTEQFLQRQIREWISFPKNQVPFSDLLDLLMTCWETKEELFTAVEGFHMETEEKEELLELIEDEWKYAEIHKANSDLSGQLLLGCFLGAGMEIFLESIRLLGEMHWIPFAAFFVLFGLMIAALVVSRYAFFLWEKISLSVLTILGAAAVWIVLMLITRSMNGAEWVARIISLCVLAVSAAGLLAKGRKKEREEEQ